MKFETFQAGVLDCESAAVAHVAWCNGKPFLAGGPFFNLSHSHNLAALAISEEVGQIGAGLLVFVGVEKGEGRKVGLEELVFADGRDKVYLGKDSAALMLVAQIRDEAHRFAITFHRQRRSKAMTASALDGIPGLGEVKRKALLKAFGSVKKMRAATPAELAEVSGIGPTLAAIIAAELSSTGSVPAVNITTGEVLDDE